MLHLESIEPATLGLLRELQQMPVLADTRLVGGTALALQLGHRTSIDLDMFGAWDYTENLQLLFDGIGNFGQRECAEGGYDICRNSGGKHEFSVHGEKLTLRHSLPSAATQDAVKNCGVP